MLDVHDPHEPVHGWRDFLLHLFTITVGLLIALSLEGMVEWHHERHLVQEAEQSLHNEIQSNAEGLPDSLKDLTKQQKELQHDVEVLDYVIANGKMPTHAGMSVHYGISTFDSVSWKTAQTTGALGYMPYPRAQEYATIYVTQDALYSAEQQAARDAILSLAAFLDTDKSSPAPSASEAKEERSKVAILQGQLMLVEAEMKSLQDEYKKFLGVHPA